MASKLYFMLHFTCQSLAILVFMWSSVSFDVIFCVLQYLMNERFLYSFSLKINEAALSYYICPHAHSNVSAASIEDLSRKNCYCLTGETLKGRQERHLEGKSLAF